MSTSMSAEYSIPVKSARRGPSIQETNQEILSAIRGCIEAAGGSYDGSTPVRVSLSRDPLSLYYDQQAGGLHVLLDGTIVLSGIPEDQQAPIGVIDVSQLRACYPNTFELLQSRLLQRLGTLNAYERQQLRQSLVVRQEAESPLTLVDIHSANAVFMLDQGWTHALTGAHNQYRCGEPSCVMQIEAFSAPDSDVIQYHLIDIYSKRENRSTSELAPPTDPPAQLPGSLESDLTSSLNDEISGIPLSWKVPPRVAAASERAVSKVPLLMGGPDLHMRGTLLSLPL